MWNPLFKTLYIRETKDSILLFIMRTRIRTYLLIIICLTHSSAYCQDAEKHLNDGLIGGWKVTPFHPVSAFSLFDISKYEEVRQEGYLLSGCPPKELVVISDRGPSTFCVFLLQMDGKFVAEDSYYIPRSSGMDKRTSRWSGDWWAVKDTLFLDLKETKNNGHTYHIHKDLEDSYLNEIYRFTYQIDSCSVSLYPQFDKEMAYRIMRSSLNAALENEFLVYSLKQSLIPILSNSESPLSAYTVQHVKEKLDERLIGKQILKSNLEFVKDIVDQWYNGYDRYFNSKRTKAYFLKESDVLGKWYLNGRNGEMALLNKFINLLYSSYMYSVEYSNILTRDYIAVLTAEVPSSTREERLELDLKKNNDFHLSSSTYMNGLEQIGETIEYSGKWSLSNNRLFFDFKNYKTLDGRSGPAYYKGEINVGMDAGHLYVSKCVLPDTIYQQVKSGVKEIRDGGVFLSSDFLQKALSVYNSPLSAHEVWLLNFLCLKIHYQRTGIQKDSSPQPDFSQKCDILDSIIDKWYKKVKVG